MEPDQNHYKTCPYSEHGICAVATRLANQIVPLNKAACGVCVTDLMPMAQNRVTGSLAVYQLRVLGLPPTEFLLQVATGRERLAGNVVERLIRKWLRRFKIRVPLNCGCEDWVKKMNDWGAEESLQHLDEITAQLFTNLKKTYLAGVAVPFLTTPLIKRMVRRCLSKELLSSP